MLVLWIVTRSIISRCKVDVFIKLVFAARLNTNDLLARQWHLTVIRLLFTDYKVYTHSGNIGKLINSKHKHSRSADT